MWRPTAGAVVSVLAGCGALLLAAPSATAPWFLVLNGGTPSVSVVDRKRLEVSATIPLADNPTTAVLSRDNRFLYVLHNGFLRYPQLGRLSNDPGRVTVVDLAERRAIKTIAIGPYASIAGLTRDGRHLVCVARGKPGAGVKPPEGSVTVIDTTTAEVVFTAKEWRWVHAVAWREDARRTFVVGTTEFQKKKRSNLLYKLAELDRERQLLFGLTATRSALSSFGEAPEARLGAVPLEHAPSVAALSRDGRWLYAVDPGEASADSDKRRPGWVYVVDAESGRPVTSHQIDPSEGVQVLEDASGQTAILAVALSAPTRLYRLAGNRIEAPIDVGDLAGIVLPDPGGAGTWFVGRGTATLVRPGTTGVAEQRRWRKPGDPETDDDAMAVVAVEGTGRLLVSTLDHRLIVLDPGSEAPRHSVSVGSQGGRAARTVGRVALFAAWIALMPGLLSVIPAAALGALQTIPVPTGLAVGDDRVTAYVIDPASDDLTMVNTDTGAVLSHHPTGSDPIGLRRMAQAPRVCGFAKNQFTVINAADNHVQVVHQPPDGADYRGAAVDDDESRVYLVLDRTIEVWDPLTGRIVGTITGLSKPRAVLWPSEQGTHKTSFFWKH
jgi:DNA-binding beta-propeller fold protein YncE